MTRHMSAVECRPPHLYEGGVIIWERGILLLFFRLFIRVVFPGRHEPSPLLATRYGTGVLDQFMAFDRLEHIYTLSC